MTNSELPPLKTLSLLQSLCPGSEVLFKQNLHSGCDNCDTCSTRRLLLDTWNGMWEGHVPSSINIDEDLRGVNEDLLDVDEGASEARRDFAGDTFADLLKL